LQQWSQWSKNENIIRKVYEQFFFVFLG
jgi:hypothetical protein